MIPSGNRYVNNTDQGEGSEIFIRGNGGTPCTSQSPIQIHRLPPVLLGSNQAWQWATTVGNSTDEVRLAFAAGFDCKSIDSNKIPVPVTNTADLTFTETQASLSMT